MYQDLNTPLQGVEGHQLCANSKYVAVSLLIIIIFLYIIIHPFLMIDTMERWWWYFHREVT
jgi:hypothetical protein